jgi:hypothetical protein
METAKIAFKGIGRRQDAGVYTDGELMEAVNVRLKDGLVEAVGGVVDIAKFGYVKPKGVWFHKMAGRIVVITESGEAMTCSDDLPADGTVRDLSVALTRLYGISGASNVEFIGNLACFTTDEGMMYVYWNGEDYEVLGSTPALPKLNVTVTSGTKALITDEKYYFNSMSDKSLYAPYVASGFIDNCISQLNEESYHLGPVLVRYALRLTDGSHILHSMPMYCCPDENGAATCAVTSGTTTYSTTLSAHTPVFYSSKDKVDRGSNSNYDYMFAGAMGWKYTFTLSDLSDVARWKHLVVGIDVYIAPLHYARKKDKTDGNGYKYTDYEILDESNMGAPDKCKETKDAYLFYKVAEFDLYGNQTWTLEDVSADNLAVQDTLDDDGYSHNRYIPKAQCVYNSYLHLANLKERLFDGYSAGFLLPFTPDTTTLGSAYTTRNVDIYTYIETDDGERTVHQSADVGFPITSPFFGYPDSRATKMVMTYTEDGVLYKKEFTLTAHKYLNFACYCSSGVVRGSTTTSSSGRRGYNEFYATNTGDFTAVSDSDSISYAEADSWAERKNIMKVSALNNPLSFPNEKTYRIGDGEIIGLKSNSVALSQGQHGQHPMYVFCSDGIWNMNVGSDGVSYKAWDSTRRDVALNANIISTDDAVVFVSDRGVIELYGREAKLLSASLDGHLPSCMDDTLLEKISKIGWSGADVRSSVIFREYLKDARLGYNYRDNEIIVANSNYGYSYVYGRESGEWTKRTVVPQLFTNSYPEAYVVIDGVLSDLRNDNITKSNILLVTRPMKLTTDDLKRVSQIALRCVIHSADTELYLRGEKLLLRDDTIGVASRSGLYLLGSMDGEKYTLLGRVERNCDVRNMISGMIRSHAYRFYVVALAGSLRTDTSINYAELTIEEAFGNRLR